MLVKRKFNIAMVEMLQISNLSFGKLRFPRIEAVQVPVHSQDSAPRCQSQVLLGYQFGIEWQMVRDSLLCVLGLDKERALEKKMQVWHWIRLPASPSCSGTEIRGSNSTKTTVWHRMPLGKILDKGILFAQAWSEMNPKKHVWHQMQVPPSFWSAGNGGTCSTNWSGISSSCPAMKILTLS